MKLTISSRNYNNKEEAKLALGDGGNNEIRTARREYFKSTGNKIGALRWIEITCDPYNFYSYCTNGFAWNQGLYKSSLQNYMLSHPKGILRKDILRNVVYVEDPFYKNTTGEFKKAYSSHDFWCGSQVMFIDVDGSDKDMDQYINDCKYKPTFAYYSYTDTGIGKRRFRLVYVLSRELNNIMEWEAISFLVHHWSPGNYDNTAKNATQTSFGTDNPAKGKWFGNILDVDSFAQVLSHLDKQTSDALERENKTKYDYPDLKLTFDNKLIQTLASDLSWSSINASGFIENRFRKLIWRKESEIIERRFIDGYEIGLTTQNYWELDLNTNYLIQDGEGRRMKLKTRAMIRRLLCPSITPEQLLVNMYYDRDKIIDNRDKVVDLRCMVSLVNSVFKYKIDTLENMLSTNQYVQGLKVKASQVVVLNSTTPERRKELRKRYVDEILDRLYNPGLSENQNILNINLELQKINARLRIDSRDRLVDYRQRKNIVKNKNRDEFILEKHKEGLSLSQISDELDVNGYNHMSREGIRRLLKRITT